MVQSVKNLPAMQEKVQSLDREDPLEKEMAAHSSRLPGKPHGQRTGVRYATVIVNWGNRSTGRLADTASKQTEPGFSPRLSGCSHPILPCLPITACCTL